MARYDMRITLQGRVCPRSPPGR